MTNVTVQSVVIGEVLPNIGRRHQGMHGDQVANAILYKLGSNQQRSIRAMSGNVQRVPQSVVKRVKNGGTHSAKELKRQLEYITRDEAVQSTWLNFNGTERDLRKNSVDTTVPLWTSSWAGNPKRGHTDHIILSFPNDTNPEVAEDIAREWGREVFGSGNFGDQWRYVGALHANTEHVHAHFIVDKRGNDHGQFLSISMKSELNYDVMRELHAKIANDHGLALNASSRLSRGIVDLPPSDIKYRIAHEAQKLDGDNESKTKAETPPMSAIERERREALVNSFAQQYRGLGEIASLTTGNDSSGFMTKLRGLFDSASDKLEEGISLMADANVNQPAFDPSSRLIEAHQAMVSDAQEAWNDIQEMNPGADRTLLEQQFAEQSREVQSLSVSEPFLVDHSTSVASDVDPYHNDVMNGLHQLRTGLSEGGDADRGVNQVFDELRDRLQAAFEVRSDELEAMGTNADEMAERMVLQGRTTGQIEGWRGQGAASAVDLDGSRSLLSELENGVGDNFEDDSKFSHYESLIISATQLGTKHGNFETGGEYVDILKAVLDNEPDMTDEERQYMGALPALMERDKHALQTALEDSRADHYDLAQGEDGYFFDSDKTDAQVAHLVDGQVASLDESSKRIDQSYMELERSFAREGSAIIDDYEIPRDLEEVVAKDQLLQADLDKRLADIPAIEQIVDRLNDNLHPSILERVRAGDATALREEIKDPAIRAAVSSEMRNEGDVGNSDERHSEPVEQFQQLARQRQLKGAEKSEVSIADIADDFGL